MFVWILDADESHAIRGKAGNVFLYNKRWMLCFIVKKFVVSMYYFIALRDSIWGSSFFTRYYQTCLFVAVVFSSKDNF